MAISSTVNRIAYTGDGAQTSFTFPYIYYDQTQLLVYVNGVLQTLASTYTVSPTTSNPEDGNPIGGTVTFLAAPANAASIVILRSLGITQGVVLNDGSNFPAKTIEKTFDQVTMMLQQHDDTLTRSIRALPTEALDMALPSVALRASSYLGFDANGKPVALAPNIASGTAVISTGSTTARFLSDRFADWFNVKDYGLKGDGVTNDMPALIALLALMTNGGVLFFPRGTYLLCRGTGGLLADTIVADNIVIQGSGPATLLDCRKADGTISNDAGNQFYNVFQATGRTSIKIRDLSIQKYGCLFYGDSCTDVTIEGISVSGLLPNASAFLFDKAIYLYKCIDVKVTKNRFINSCFAVYISGDSVTQSSHVKVWGNHFEITLGAGAYTSLFPVGVYGYYAKHTTITGNTFRNIYSSLDSGTPGTGMGYAIYEGDGKSYGFTAQGNTIELTGRGSKRAVGILTSTDTATVIANNTIRVTGGAGNLYFGVWSDSYNTGMSVTIANNAIYNDQASGHAIYVTSQSAAYTGTRNITGNTISGVGCITGINVNGNIGWSVEIANNTIDQTGGPQITVAGAASSLQYPTIIGNRLTRSVAGAITGGACVGIQILNNTILDGNTSAAAGDAGAAIILSSYGFGCRVTGNTIGNTISGGGKFVQALSQASANTSRIFKDIVANNTLLGFNTTSQWGTYMHTVSPTVSFWDIEYGDVVANTRLDAAEAPGWVCVISTLQALTADASSASTTVTVASTAGYVAGDLILLCKSNNPLISDYTDTTKWHATTVQSVTNGTQFVVVDAIPAGDGTYANGVAFCKQARFKPLASIGA